MRRRNLAVVVSGLLPVKQRPVGFVPESLMCSNYISKRDLSSAGSIAYQEWGVGNPKKVLAVHGWLDNSNTFIRTGQTLAKNGYHIVAVDNAGHGLSGHRERVEDYNLLTNVADVSNLIKMLKWDNCFMIGHSMGSAICIRYAAANPKKVDKLVIMEQLGPLSTSSTLMRELTEVQVKATIKNSPLKEIPSLMDAVRIKQKAATMYSKNLVISDEAAKEIIRRGSTALTSDPNGPLKMRHDPRLSIIAYMYYSNNDVLPHITSLECELLSIDGQNGWPPTDKEAIQQIDMIKTQMLARGLWSDGILPGSHHLHADPETEQAVNSAILYFLNK
jgi:pimeloyl-ACP methyl ester carboxylesterase